MVTNLIGTIQGKLAAMNSSQKEMYKSIIDLRAAEKDFNTADDNFMEAAICKMDAAEQHLRAIVRESSERKGMSLEEAMECDTSISRVAKLGFNGHLIYN